MTTFIVTTQESVQGTYSVEAATAEEAEAKFGNPRIDWDGVNQQEYLAYEVSVEKVEPA